MRALSARATAFSFEEEVEREEDAAECGEDCPQASAPLVACKSANVRGVTSGNSLPLLTDADAGE
jgi:hypothetical protein